MIKLSNVIKEVTSRAKLKEHGEQSGVKSGFWQLDKQLDGLNNGELILVSARPGMGKTTLVTQIASNVAGQAEDKPVLYFSLEYSAYQCAKRLMSLHLKCGTDLHLKFSLESFKTDDYEWLEAAGILSWSPLYIDDSSITTNKICRRANARNKKWRLIVIDGVGLHNNNIEKAAKSFKRLAKDLDVPVIFTLGLTSELENRQDRRPRLTDIKNFAELAKYVDTVLLLYREAYYEPGADPNTAEIIVAKSHYGEVGTVRFSWEGGSFSTIT